MKIHVPDVCVNSWYDADQLVISRGTSVDCRAKFLRIFPSNGRRAAEARLSSRPLSLICIAREEGSSQFMRLRVKGRKREVRRRCQVYVETERAA